MNIQTDRRPRASWNFRNVFFMEQMMKDVSEVENIPPDMPLMRNIYRHTKTFIYVTIDWFLYSRSSKFNHFGDNLKCFHNPERVLLVHNHLPLSCIGGECTSYPTTTNVAYLHHHRQTCPQSLRKICKEEFMRRTKRDTTMWRWREVVMRRVGESLKNIGLISWWNNVQNLTWFI